MRIFNCLKLLMFMSIFTILASCSEFMLIPISIDYPFDEESAASPSSYEINISEGLEMMENLFTKSVESVTDDLLADLKNQGAEIAYPTFKTEDILDLIKGKTVTKTISYTLEVPEIGPESGEESIDFTICNFKDKETGEFKITDSEIEMEFKNIQSFCKLSEAEKNAEVARCSETPDDACLYVEAKHKNKPIKILMAEQKELKKYKRFLNKIYSATLNDITFTIQNPPVVAAESAFYLKSELYVQATDFFKDENGEKVLCTDKEEEAENSPCVSYGINQNGEAEDYFLLEDEKILKNYLIGVFEAQSFNQDEIIKLIYAYEGKDLMQKAIKHLDFQLGLRSSYIFYPQALKPEGTLTANIKAKLLFYVEPLN